MEPRAGPWWPLLPLGLLSLGCIAALAARDTSWREEPFLFSGATLVMGTAYLAGLSVVRSRRIPRAAVLWVLAVGTVLNLVGTGLWHSDDVNRYAVEGRQILAGQNPYLVPPADPTARALVSEDLATRVNHPTLTAIYPPVVLLLEAGAQAVSPGLPVFTWLACTGALLAIALSLLLLRRLGMDPGLVLAVAWNPVLPVFASGEAHNDIIMAVLLLAALLLCAHGRRSWMVVLATLAVLAKPFAAIILPALLTSTGWRRWWLVPLTAIALYLPFIGAGGGLFSSLFTFGGSMHFHGVLDPWLRIGLAQVLPPAQVELAVRLVLLTLLAGGLAWLWSRRGAAGLPTLAVRGLAVLLLCLPTLHPWYFIVIVVLLPFTRSWALPLWTASAGVYWLHGVRILETGDWTETGWVTALAHLPALTLLLIEAFAPRRAAEGVGQRPQTESLPAHA